MLPSTTIDNRAVAVQDPQSISFDGVDEELFNDSLQTLGIANEWSVQVNYEPAALTSTEAVFSTRGTTSSGIICRVFGSLADDPFQVLIRNSSGSEIKRYLWTSVHTVGVKVSMICTWDGTNLLLYVDGTLTSPSSTPGNTTGTMTDATRGISIGSTEGEGESDSFFAGKIHSASVWDTVLTQAQVTVLENSGTPYALDNLFSAGGGNLVHYWRLGLDSSDIGKDSGTGTPIDIGDNAVNITAADIVTY